MLAIQMTCFIRPLQISEIDYLQEMLYEAIFVSEGNDPPPKSVVNTSQNVPFGAINGVVVES